MIYVTVKDLSLPNVATREHAPTLRARAPQAAVPEVGEPLWLLHLDVDSATSGGRRFVVAEREWTYEVQRRDREPSYEHHETNVVLYVMDEKSYMLKRSRDAAVAGR